MHVEWITTKPDATDRDQGREEDIGAIYLLRIMIYHFDRDYM